MKTKGDDLFAAIPPPDESPLEGEQTHFASLAPVCRPLMAWLEKRFGNVSHGGGGDA